MKIKGNDWSSTASNGGDEIGEREAAKLRPKRQPLPNPRPPFSMSNQEFQGIGLQHYRLKKDPNLRSQGYRHPPRQALRLQMALMYEVLALKAPLDHEAEERALQIQELLTQIQERKKQGQSTKGLQD